MDLSRAGMFVIGTIVLCASGCGDSHDAVARDMLSTMKELSAAVKGVKDEASVQEAVTRLEALADRMKALKKRSDTLGEAPKEIANTLRTKYEQEFREASDSIRQDFAQLDPQYAIRLQDALNRILSATGN
jgi:predicted transcriptional regulator